MNGKSWLKQVYLLLIHNIIPSRYEHCVSCYERTHVEKITSIHLRQEYVQGAGQLCMICYNMLYPISHGCSNDD